MSEYLVRTKECPQQNQWVAESEADENADLTGAYLTHTGVVRKTSRAFAHGGSEDARPVTGMLLSYDPDKTEDAIADTLKLPGVYFIRVWINEGRLVPGDIIMQVMVGGDIRTNVIGGLQHLLEKLKSICITEEEQF